MEVLRLKQLLEKLKVSHMTINSWVENEGFPKPFALSPKVVVWDEAEVNNWLTRKKEMSDGSRSEGTGGDIHTDVRTASPA